MSITDNADPMNVARVQARAQGHGRAAVCRQPVFAKGASDTDQSLIGTATSMVVENNYGYTGPTSTSRARPRRPASRA